LEGLKYSFSIQIGPRSQQNPILQVSSIIGGRSFLLYSWRLLLCSLRLRQKYQALTANKKAEGDCCCVSQQVWIAHVADGLISGHSGHQSPCPLWVDFCCRSPLQAFLVSDSVAVMRFATGADHDGAVCTENPIRIDWRRESPNVGAQ
jgi:hypothetical protein